MPVYLRKGLYCVWLVAALLLTACPDPEATECSACDQVYCLGNRVVNCDCYDDYPHGGYGRRVVVVDDCEESGGTCTVTVQGKGSQSHTTGYVQGDAACLNSCDTPEMAECRTQGDLSTWFVCLVHDAPPATWNDAAIAWIERPDKTPPSVTNPDALYAWRDANVACVPCQSDCGCEKGKVCVEGYCIPGSAPRTLVCCGREQGTTCPIAAACEQLDASQGTCETVARCEVCETNSNCAEGACVSLVEDQPSVCVGHFDDISETLGCYSDTEIWLKDACDRWIERYALCDPGFHCEVDQCTQNLPDIEVSPTLLSFADTALGQSTSMTLSIGNIGRAPLTVSEITTDAAVASVLSVSPTQATVAVNQIVTVTVTFTPSAEGPISARLYVRSDDSDEAEITVLINAAGVP